MRKERILHILIKLCFVAAFAATCLLFIFHDQAKDVDIAELGTYMTTNADFTDMEACTKTELRRFYQLNADENEGYFYYKNTSTMSVDEILIVKCSSKEQALQIFEAIETHHKNQIDIFDGYGTDQIGLLNSAVLDTKGNYAFYMCGKNADAWRKLLLSQI